MSLVQNLIEGDIDIQAFSLFFNADASTDVPRRLNLPVHSLSHYEQYLEALKSVYTQTDGMVTVNGVAVKPVTVAVRDAIDAAILGDYKTQLEQQIASVAGGKKAYTTYALMVADKNNIAANSSIDVTNDTDPLKNGTYSYDGAVFAKSIYDVETIVRTKVLNTFKTKSLMDASALPDGADAQVTDDTVNNGLYVKTAGAWVKSAYDPVEQAKLYTDTAKQAAISASKIYTNNNTLEAKKGSPDNKNLISFKDERGASTWLEVSEDGGLTDSTIKYFTDIGFIKPIKAVSDDYFLVVTDAADRVANTIDAEGGSNNSTNNTNEVDLAVASFFGSSTMGYMQDDIYNAIKNKYPNKIYIPKYYGASGSMMNHTLSVIGVNNGRILFTNGVIPVDTSTAITSASLPYGMPTFNHTVKGSLQNNIHGVIASSTFKADNISSKVFIDSDLDIEFISDGSLHNNAVAFVNIGKNNISSSVGMHKSILEATRAAVNYLDSHNDGHTIILGHFVDLNSPEGEKLEINSLNRKMKSLYADRFIDIQAYIMSNEVWTDLGLTKTSADIAAIEAGQLPPSLGRDGAHLSADVDSQIANKILNVLTNKGWYL